MTACGSCGADLKVTETPGQDPLSGEPGTIYDGRVPCSCGLGCHDWWYFAIPGWRDNENGPCCYVGCHCQPRLHRRVVCSVPKWMAAG